MSSMIAKALKRKAWPFDFNGQKIYLRAMSHKESREVAGVPEHLQGIYVLGCCEVDAAGVAVCGRSDGESLEEYLTRLESVYGDIDEPTFLELAQMIEKVTKAPDVGKLEKN